MTLNLTSSGALHKLAPFDAPMLTSPLFRPSLCCNWTFIGTLTWNNTVSAVITTHRKLFKSNSRQSGFWTLLPPPGMASMVADGDSEDENVDYAEKAREMKAQSRSAANTKKRKLQDISPAGGGSVSGSGSGAFASISSTSMYSAVPASMTPKAHTRNSSSSTPTLLGSGAMTTPSAYYKAYYSDGPSSKIRKTTLAELHQPKPLHWNSPNPALSAVANAAAAAASIRQQRLSQSVDEEEVIDEEELNSSCANFVGRLYLPISVRRRSRPPISPYFARAHAKLQATADRRAFQEMHSQMAAAAQQQRQSTQQQSSSPSTSQRAQSNANQATNQATNNGNTFSTFLQASSRPQQSASNSNRETTWSSANNSPLLLAPTPINKARLTTNSSPQPVPSSPTLSPHSLLPDGYEQAHPIHPISGAAPYASSSLQWSSNASTISSRDSPADLRSLTVEDLLPDHFDAHSSHSAATMAPNGVSNSSSTNAYSHANHHASQSSTPSSSSNPSDTHSGAHRSGASAVSGAGSSAHSKSRADGTSQSYDHSSSYSTNNVVLSSTPPRRQAKILANSNLLAATAGLTSSSQSVSAMLRSNIGGPYTFGGGSPHTRSSSSAANSSSSYASSSSHAGSSSPYSSSPTPSSSISSSGGASTYPASTSHYGTASTREKAPHPQVLDPIIIPLPHGWFEQSLKNPSLRKRAAADDIDLPVWKELDEEEERIQWLPALAIEAEDDEDISDDKYIANHREYEKEEKKLKKLCS